VVIAEFSTPPSPLVRGPYAFYGRHVLPRIAGLINREAAEAYRYLNESIEAWPDQDELGAWMREAGFERVAYRNLTLGIVALHRGFVRHEPKQPAAPEPVATAAPAAKTATADAPAAAKKPAPAAKKPAPAAKKPAPAPKKPAAAKAPATATKKPAAKKPAPAAKKPATNAPTTTKPTTKAPAAKAPAAKKPAAKKPAAAKPAAKPVASANPSAPERPEPKAGETQ
jgi:demethylmenaquinone methyltransferase/2-methoxy-6-polyprenyl-1,4-benzoquinol methylase